MMNRLSMLPVEHIFRKLDYFSHFRAKGFAGYRSPWVPVSRGNFRQVREHLEREGGLVVNGCGTEIPYPEGRNIEYGRSGKIRYKLSVSFEGGEAQNIKFVWIDSRASNPAELAGDMKEEYEQYNQYLREFLAYMFIHGQSLDRVKFPLFHCTGQSRADEILHSGFDYNEIQETKSGHCGFSVLAATDPMNAKRFWEWEESKNEPGSIVLLKPFDDNRVPVWLDLDPIVDSEPVQLLDLFLQRNNYLLSPKHEQTPAYTWQIVCKDLFHDELPVTAVFLDKTVNIYEPDPFAYYEPFDVMEG